MTDRIVAAFDFDGTITTTDSFRHFVRQAVGTPRFAWAGLRALPWIVAMKAGLLSRGDAKAKFASFAFGPIREDVLDAQARRFVDSYLPNLVRPEMLERVREHRARGHEVVLVSASPSLYLEKWAKTAGFDAVLATRLAFERGVFAGRLDGENCWGRRRSCGCADGGATGRRSSCSRTATAAATRKWPNSRTGRGSAGRGRCRRSASDEALMPRVAGVTRRPARGARRETGDSRPSDSHGRTCRRR